MLFEYDDSTLNNDLTAIFISVDEQIKNNLDKYKRHPTIEHSLSVLLEEVEELKQEVFRIEVAATAVRAILDLRLYKIYIYEKLQ